MFLKLTVFLLVAVLALSACSSQPEIPQTEPPGDTPTSGEGESQQPTEEGYPGPDAPTGDSAEIDPAYLSPQPGDENLTRGPATVEIADSELLVMESFPVQIVASLQGYLPNPCHDLRAVVGSPDEQNTVHIEVYSVVDPEMMCIEVIEPFAVRLPLGSYQDATYRFFVNGELLGEVET
jgi:hypothetical protein